MQQIEGNGNACSPHVLTAWLQNAQIKEKNKNKTPTNIGQNLLTISPSLVRGYFHNDGNPQKAIAEETGWLQSAVSKHVRKLIKGEKGPQSSL